MRPLTVFLLFWVVLCAVSHLHEHESSGFLPPGQFHSHSHDSEEDHHHLEQTHHHHHKKSEKLSNWKRWVYSLSAVFGISVAPCLLLFFIPAQSKAANIRQEVSYFRRFTPFWPKITVDLRYSFFSTRKPRRIVQRTRKWPGIHTNGPFLKILLAFGAGGLLGDALLHIIPHSLSPHDHSEGHHDHDHDHNHSHDHSAHLRVGIYVISGILVFMMVEQVVRIIKGGHCHSHENGHIVADEHRHLNDGEHDKSDKKEEIGLKDVKASAYLNLVADFVHNVTDGLAIGASFSAGSTLGWLTTLTVLLHELPHEVGDFAILVQSGFSKYKAIRMQIVTALGAITGCVFSLIVSDPSGKQSNGGADTSAIMPFTAGGFIYIATVSVIPELLESGEHKNMSKGAKMAQSLVHLIAICAGVAMMYIVSLIE